MLDDVVGETRLVGIGAIKGIASISQKPPEPKLPLMVVLGVPGKSTSILLRMK